MNHQLNEEACPVPESLLGQLYRSSPQGLATLIDTVPAGTRAMLAVYCYRRSHLASIGMAIASTCDEHDLLDRGGNVGADLFAKSRVAEHHDQSSEKRNRITLSRGPLMRVIAEDLV